MDLPKLCLDKADTDAGLEIRIVFGGRINICINCHRTLAHGTKAFRPMVSKNLRLWICRTCKYSHKLDLLLDKFQIK